MSNYLLEIGLEEIPAHLVTSSELQLKQRMIDFLTENKIDFKNVISYSTPRRLSVLVENISEKTDSFEEEFRGPSIKVAKDGQDNWSKAALGFAKGKGKDADALFEKEGYVYIKNKVESVSTESLLTSVGKVVIEKMQFSTYMKWGNNDFKFIRPIEWLVSLFDKKVIPFSILDIDADRFSFGHRYLANKKITIDDAIEYVQKTKDFFVDVDRENRKLSIQNQIEQLAEKNSWIIPIDGQLLDEVTNIVEWPTALTGRFDEKYLGLPNEVLITSMKNHQRYFYVLDSNNEILPIFVTVRNGDEKKIENVSKGNERVLKARLEDADFFYREDVSKSIDFFMKKIEKVVFHEKIGLLTDHMKRTAAIASYIADKVSLAEVEAESLKRATSIYKFDLVTNMVDEFDELQGIIGGIYANQFGENELVSQSISEQYLPIGFESELPKTQIGAILSAADKLDAIFSFFAANLIPSGSKDPFALRRAASGFVRISNKFSWNFNLVELINDYQSAISKSQLGLSEELIGNFDKNKEKIIEFVNDRIRQQLLEKVDADVVEAIIGRNSNDNVHSIITDAIELNDLKRRVEFNKFVENFDRAVKLSKEIDEIPEVNSELLESKSEQELFEFSREVNLNDSSLTQKFERLIPAIALLENYLEENLVNAPEERVKFNRLSQLKKMAEFIQPFGDLSKLLLLSSK